MFALFKDGEQISKGHSTRAAAQIEAFERGVVSSAGMPDFEGDPPQRGSYLIATGYEIKMCDQERKSDGSD